MRALVVSASRHGSTHEIAEAIADELRAQQIDVDRKNVGESIEMDGYDAVVMGSAVYIGHWLPEAMRFVEENLRPFTSRPLFLFSSGPLSEGEPKDGIDDQLVTKLMTETGARGHRLFAGALQPAELGLKEKLATKIVRAPTGDFRDWEKIREWAREIAQTLAAA